MSSASSHGSPGAPQLTYSNPNMARRTSYASVAAGATGGGHHTGSTQGGYSQIYSDQPSRIPLPIPTDSDAQVEGSTRIPETWGSGSRAAMSNLSTSEFPRQTYWAPSRTISDIGGFFIPTYLRGSKYMEELEAAHNANLAVQKEEQSRPRSSHGSLSKSSSTVSLPKMQASHRGMAYEIIEHQPVVVEAGPEPLPSKWVEVDKHNSIEIAGDGQQVRFVGLSKLADHEAAAARSDHPMPVQAGIYYYEVYIESKGKDGVIGVGFSGAKASLEKLPGWEPDSWAYHGDDGKIFSCQPTGTGKHFGPTFSSGDTIGCGVNFMDGTAFFTKNGDFLGDAFRDMKETALYPSVGMKRPTAHLIVNFGQRPFVFGIDKLIERRKSDILSDISLTDTSTLHPSLDKDELCKALVAQYLSHDGYVETAQAFAEEMRRENSTLLGTPESPVANYLAVEEDHDAANRQQIRAAALEGDIDTAILLTNTYFPTVLSTHREINFRLRCRKYIEMMRQSALLLDNTHHSPRKALKTLNNGHLPSDAPQAMDLDPPTNTPAYPSSNSDNWDKDQMDTSVEPIDTDGAWEGPTTYDEIVNKAITYGQELNHEFKDELDPVFREQFKETMKELFGMLAYKDVRTSPAARWLDVAERVKVGEGLNGAILVSLGKSSSTALERIYRQTVVLTDMISEDGGPGCLINVRRMLNPSSSTYQSANL